MATGRKDKKHVGLQRKYNDGGITGKGFRKGQSGNPSGKRKGSVSLSATLKNIITQKQAEGIISDLLNIATNKPVQRTVYGKDGAEYEAFDSAEIRLYEFAVTTILERLDGKVTQPIGGDPDRPPVFIVESNLPGLLNGEHKRD